MRYSIVIRFAVRELGRAPLRSALSALGMIVGVASVVTMVSIGNGAREEVMRALSDSYSHRIVVTASPRPDPSRNGARLPLPDWDGLKVGDYRAIQREVAGVSLSTVQTLLREQQVDARGRHMTASVWGIDSEGLELILRKLSSGSMFSPHDVGRGLTVCVITESLARALFGNLNPLGKELRISSVPFVVVGLIADLDTPDPANPTAAVDTTVLIPFTSLMRRLHRTDRVAVVLTARDPMLLPLLKERVTDLMERRRGPRRAEFTTGNVSDSVIAYEAGYRTMTLLLGAIASISLLVGGIGIMNITLAGVAQRVREIGIRIAIGTRGRDVLKQILAESVTLGVLGGLAGLGVGIAASGLLTWLNGWPTKVTFGTIAIALLCSTGVAVVSGFYPARTAARLLPVQTLRMD